MLNCPGCYKDFSPIEIATISETHSLDPFLAGSDLKPEFPDGGMVFVCPNCKKSFTYQRHELIFRSS
jgi:hypothetical protein